MCGATWQNGELVVDSTVAIVAAAQHVDLLYLYIVALRARSGRLHVGRTAWHPQLSVVQLPTVGQLAPASPKHFSGITPWTRTASAGLHRVSKRAS